MSHGGKPDKKRDGIRGPRPAAAPGEFGRAVSTIAVAQICEHVGFESFKESTLDSLADIAIRYIKDLGKAANFYASLAHRTECNVFDVIRGLEDLGDSGLSSSSRVGFCLSDSSIVKGIMEFVDSAAEVPFAQPIPRFPVVRVKRRIPSFSQVGETPEVKYVPDWLPAFPDPHTYIQTPVWNERSSDPRADKIELARQRRKAESSLLNLQQRLVSTGSELVSAASLVPEGKKTSFPAIGSTSKEVVDDGMGSHLADRENPFLEPRLLQSGEKDLSPVLDLPTEPLNVGIVENHVSVLSTFAPAIEAAKGRVPELDGDSSEINLPDYRPAVRLNLNIGKKMVGESLDLRLWNRGSGRVASWFGRNDDKDDKKRRAELILRQSMENHLELTQL